MRRRSSAWSLAWRLLYALARMFDPVLRAAWRHGALGITVELTVRGRRTGAERATLVGLLRLDDTSYVGHPNGDTGWTRNLEAAGEALVRAPYGGSAAVVATRLPYGPERDSVIRATAVQQFPPANLLYRAAQRHILAVGTYFRVTPR